MGYRKYIVPLLSMVTLLLIFSCTKEDTDDCFAGLRLKFKFTLHNNGGNLFGKEVQQVRVYLFDEGGVLRLVAKDNGAHLTNDYVMDINLSPGKYTILSWGGSNEDFLNSYFEGHMNDPITHNYEDGVTPGKTTLKEFRVMLKHNIADELPEDIVPVVDELDDLYYGAVGTRTPETSRYVFEQVEVKNGALTEREIELIKNTNLIKLTINGLKYLRHYNPGTYRMARTSASDVLQVWATARNGRYKFDNTIGEYARSIRYTPHSQTISEDTMMVDLKILRLDLAQRTAQPVYLTVLNPLTGVTFPATPIDVINILLQARNPLTGEYIYKNQEDFDREYEHPIQLVIGADLYVRIFVRGWEIITLKPEV